MRIISSKPRAWLIILLSISTLSLNSCFWFNEPNAEESGSLELSEDDISGVTYTYKVYLNDSSNPDKGFGFLICVNDKELIRQSHENLEGEITLFNSEESARTAAIATLTSLKTRANLNEAHAKSPE